MAAGFPMRNWRNCCRDYEAHFFALYPFLYFGPFFGKCLWAEGVTRSIYRPEKPKGNENCGRQSSKIRAIARKSPREIKIVGGRAVK